MSMVFKTGEPEVNDVEEEYWRLVLERDVHMQFCFLTPGLNGVRMNRRILVKDV